MKSPRHPAGAFLLLFVGVVFLASFLRFNEQQLIVLHCFRSTETLTHYTYAIQSLEQWGQRNTPALRKIDGFFVYFYMPSRFDPTRHVLAVRVSFTTPVLESGWTGVLQVAGLPTDTTHAQVLERNSSVFDFLSANRNDLHVRERIAVNHGKLTFGYLPHPLPRNSRGQFLVMPERTWAAISKSALELVDNHTQYSLYAHYKGEATSAG